MSVLRRNWMNLWPIRSSLAGTRPQATWCVRLCACWKSGSARNAQLAAFDRELSVRLAALDHGESVESGEVRQRLKQKSWEWPG